MSGQRRDSSCANGIFSRGPITLEGQERSSRNATHHSHLESTRALQGQSQDDFAAILDQHVQSFHPETPVEMTSACWRIRRKWAMETRLRDNQIDWQVAMTPWPG